MMSHHRIALRVILAALALDAAGGVLFASAQHIPMLLGLYCALANAVTVGGTVPPSTPAGYVVTAGECLLVVPLFAATFSLFTSGLTGTTVHAAKDEIKAHVEDQMKAHLLGVTPAPSRHRREVPPP